MNFIDIASWQAGLNLESLFAQNPSLDGVIVKATQGLTYVNPEYVGWTKWLAEHGKPFGVYHYCCGTNSAQEAELFYKTVKPYIGKCIPVADYEGDALSSGTVWLKKFLDRFYELSGVRCMIYCSISVVQEQNFSALTAHPLWIAQYADMANVNGFIDSPWQRGSVSPFAKYWMHQYTSRGLLKGWGGIKVTYDENGNKHETVTGYLDFDKFYGTVNDWNSLCVGKDIDVPSKPETPAAERSAGRPFKSSTIEG